MLLFSLVFNEMIACPSNSYCFAPSSKTPLIRLFARFKFDWNLAIPLLILALTVGCQPTVKEDAGEKPGETGKQPSQVDGASKKEEVPVKGSDPAAARSLIRECLENYQKLQSYEDNAVARFRVPYAENPIDESGPIRIAFERPNRLALHMVQLRSSTVGSQFESIVGEGATRPFENQRVVRPMPEKITLDWLLVDHLQNPLENRIFGTPLSLQMLLESSPLHYLLQEQNQLAFLSRETFDGVLCERIRIEWKGLQWVLWIDEARKLVLRYELPIELVQQAIPPIPADLDRSKILFSVDFAGIRVNEKVDWAKWEVPRKKDDFLVRRFADPPPRSLPKTLGKKLTPFSLKDTEQVEVFDLASRRKPVAILHWIDNSDLSRRFCEEIVKLDQMLVENGLDSSCENILVSSLSADAMKVALKSWDCKLPIGIDRNNSLAIECGVRVYRTSVVLDREGRVQSLDETPLFQIYPDRLKEISLGVDAASRIISAALNDEARYASRLHRYAVDRNQIQDLPEIHREITPFPFLFHEMKREWKAELENKLLAASGEWFPPQVSSDALKATDILSAKENAYRVMTTLDDAGQLHMVDQNGRKSLVATIPIEQANNAKRIHILPDPWTHQWIAIVPEGLPRFWYIVAPKVTTGAWQATEAVQLALSDGESIRSAVWAHRGGVPKLCLVTDKQRLHVLNPSDQKLETSKPSSGVRSEMIATVPRLDEKGRCIEWNTLWTDQSLNPIPGLSEGIESKSISTKLAYEPEASAWLWGKGASGSYLIGLARLESGETGAAIMNNQYDLQYRHALTVRPEQSRLLGATSLADNTFYWVATAPNRVLHLQTVDGPPVDQMSLGTRIYGAALLPEGKNIRLVTAIDGEVSCWTVTPIAPTPQP